MLNAIDIVNYQSHKSTSIEFVPGFNVITGTSDAGKSAILRAMLWAINNRPSGEAFKSWFAKKDDTVSVSMEFDNDWFTKERTSKNKYITETDTYEALRSDVPEPISAIHNIVDYNIQTQFQPYFLLQNSSGDRAKMLNELVGLNIIDQVFKKLNGKIQITKSEIKAGEAKILKLNDEIGELSKTLSAESLINSLASDISDYEKIVSSTGSVRQSIQDLTAIDAEIEQHKKILAAEVLHHTLEDKLDTYKLDKIVKDDLNETICNWHNIVDQIEEDKSWLAVEVPYTELKNHILGRGLVSDSLDELDKLTDSIAKLDSDIHASTAYLEAQLEKYTGMLLAEGVCPTCKQTVDLNTAESIIESMR